jgi:SH3-like domain-containing protein
LPAVFLAALLTFAGCAGDESKKGEAAFVTVPQVNLRDRVAAVYNKTGSVSNGERVEVLEHTRNGRFVRVRSSRGEEGWLEQRYLAGQEVFDAFQKLTHQHAADPAQARATVRSDLNMHVAPSRDSDHLYQSKEGDKVDVLLRATAEKVKTGSPGMPEDGRNASPLPVIEDWWLVRSAAGHCGWALSRSLDEDAPLEVAQYAEGQRIVAYFVVNYVQDKDKTIPQYLLLLNEPRDGSPVDFNQIRVFTWNRKRQRYETAYRERKLNGFLPARVSEEDFGKDGKLPVFTIRVQDGGGKTSERKYKLDGVMVRRVLAPEQEQAVSSTVRKSRPRQ